MFQEFLYFQGTHTQRSSSSGGVLGRLWFHPSVSIKGAILPPPGPALLPPGGWGYTVWTKGCTASTRGCTASNQGGCPASTRWVGDTCGCAWEWSTPSGRPPGVLHLFGSNDYEYSAVTWRPFRRKKSWAGHHERNINMVKMISLFLFEKKGKKGNTPFLNVLSAASMTKLLICTK